MWQTLVPESIADTVGAHIPLAHIKGHLKVQWTGLLHAIRFLPPAPICLSLVAFFGFTPREGQDGGYKGLMTSAANLTHKGWELVVSPQLPWSSLGQWWGVFCTVSKRVPRAVESQLSLRNSSTQPPSLSWTVLLTASPSFLGSPPDRLCASNSLSPCLLVQKPNLKGVLADTEVAIITYLSKFNSVCNALAQSLAHELLANKPTNRKCSASSSSSSSLSSFPFPSSCCLSSPVS